MNSQKIYPPYLLVDYRGAVKVSYLYDDIIVNSVQASGPVEVPPGLPVVPRIILQALNNAQQHVGPIWTWEPELDYGRGSWVTFDPKIHKIPITIEEPEEPVAVEEPVQDMFDDEGANQYGRILTG